MRKGIESAAKYLGHVKQGELGGMSYHFWHNGEERLCRDFEDIYIRVVKRSGDEYITHRPHWLKSI